MSTSHSAFPPVTRWEKVSIIAGAGDDVTDGGSVRPPVSLGVGGRDFQYRRAVASTGPRGTRKSSGGRRAEMVSHASLRGMYSVGEEEGEHCRQRRRSRAACGGMCGQPDPGLIGEVRANHCPPEISSTFFEVLNTERPAAPARRRPPGGTPVRIRASLPARRAGSSGGAVAPTKRQPLSCHLAPAAGRSDFRTPGRARFTALRRRDRG